MLLRWRTGASGVRTAAVHIARELDLGLHPPRLALRKCQRTYHVGLYRDCFFCSRDCDLRHPSSTLVCCTCSRHRAPVSCCRQLALCSSPCPRVLELCNVL